MASALNPFAAYVVAVDAWYITPFEAIDGVVGIRVYPRALADLALPASSSFAKPGT